MFKLQLDRAPMKASSGAISQRKIASIMLFFELTSGAIYGWRTADDRWL
jgi:hypothetical protein